MRLWLPSRLLLLPSRLLLLPSRLLLLLPRHLCQLWLLRLLPAGDGFQFVLQRLDAPARCPLSVGGFDGPTQCANWFTGGPANKAVTDHHRALDWQP
jgi:hypothetical protein